jgi:hypothetical protein
MVKAGIIAIPILAILVVAMCAGNAFATSYSSYELSNFNSGNNAV